MQHSFQTLGLERCAVGLLHLAIEGDAEAHVQARGNSSPWHLLPLPPGISNMLILSPMSFLPGRTSILGFTASTSSSFVYLMVVFIILVILVITHRLALVRGVFVTLLYVPVGPPPLLLHRGVLVLVAVHHVLGHHVEPTALAIIGDHGVEDLLGVPLMPLEVALYYHLLAGVSHEGQVVMDLIIRYIKSSTLVMVSMTMLNN